jgi:pimeloyl-ACP methyl ester carboxylesterase
MFKKYFLIFICLTFFSCKKNTYEYITKDKTFRDSIQTGFFTELSHGFTYYEIDNRKSEDVIVFIHGYSVPSYIWDKTYNSAKEKGFKVIRIDLYGRGYSENPIAEYSDSLFANQVIELLDELEIENAEFYWPIKWWSGNYKSCRFKTKYCK